MAFHDLAQGRLVQFDKAAPVECHNQLQWRAHQCVERTPPCDLWNRNGEHCAAWLMGAEPKSPQVTGALVVGLIGTFLGLAKLRITC